MDLVTLLALIQNGTSLVNTITQVVEQASEVLSDDDAAEVRDALAELQAKNNATYDRVMSKLSEAAKK